jgi:hypothetical protein
MKMEEMLGENGKVELCDLCEPETPAFIACTECVAKLCEYHQKAHMLTKQTKNHVLVPIELFSIKLQQLTPSNLSQTNANLEYGKTCILHHNFPENKYCETCSELCCAECAYIPKHSEHKSKIGTIEDIHVELVKYFTETILPETNKKLETLLVMNSAIETWNRTLDDHHNEAMMNLENEREMIEVQYKKQKMFLNSAYSNSKNGITLKKDEVAGNIKEIRQVIYRVESSLVNEDIFDLPMKKTEFINSLSKIEHPTITKIITKPLIQSPIQYAVLKKKRKHNEIQYFTEFEVVKPSDPFRDISIDLKNQIITIQLEFDSPDFKGLGFDEKIPYLEFNFVYDEDQEPKLVIDFEYQEKENSIDGNRVVINGKVQCDGNCGDQEFCRHRFKWIKTASELGSMQCRINGVTYKYSIPCGLKLLK